MNAVFEPQIIAILGSIIPAVIALCATVLKLREEKKDVTRHEVTVTIKDESGKSKTVRIPSSELTGSQIADRLRSMASQTERDVEPRTTEGDGDPQSKGSP
jgi:hypothetical protein